MTIFGSRFVLLTLGLPMSRSSGGANFGSSNFGALGGTTGWTLFITGAERNFQDFKAKSIIRLKLKHFSNVLLSLKILSACSRSFKLIAN